jgi:hypothetical protein
MMSREEFGRMQSRPILRYYRFFKKSLYADT